MTSLQNLLKYTKLDKQDDDEAEFYDQQFREDKKEPYSSPLDEESDDKERDGSYSGSKYSEDTESAEPGATKAQIAEHERIMTDFGQKIAIAEARSSGRMKDRAAETPPAKDWKEQLGRHLGQTVGTIGSASKLATEVGGAAASAANQPPPPQSRIEQNPAGVGTGKATALANRKGSNLMGGARQGTVPRLSMSAKVRMNKPVTPPPSKLPIAAMMEKDYVNDKYEEEFGQHDIPERKTKDHMKVSGKGVQNLQKLIGERAQQVKKKRGN